MFWPSLSLVLHLLFSYDRWLAFVPIALAAAIAGTTLPGVARKTAIAYMTTAAAVIAGFTYILWDDLTYILDEHQSSTPTPRAVGSIVLLSAVLAPLLIQPLLRRDFPVARGGQAARRRGVSPTTAVPDGGAGPDVRGACNSSY